MNVSWQEWLANLYDIDGLEKPLVGVICLGVSGLCGAIVGIERERRLKPAGLRTLILIALGSTMFTIASLMVSGFFTGTADGNWRPDPGRVASQVVTGIGFLGAGAIIHSRRSVVGMTTAASIWVVAAVGMVVGLGYAAAGVILSILLFIVLGAVRYLDRWISGKCRFRWVEIDFEDQDGKMYFRLLSLLDEHNLRRADYRLESDPQSRSGRLDLRYCEIHPQHRTALGDLARMPGVLEMRPPPSARPQRQAQAQA